MLSRSGMISGIGLDLLIFYQVAGLALEQGAQAINIISKRICWNNITFFLVWQNGINRVAYYQPGDKYMIIVAFVTKRKFGSGTRAAIFVPAGWAEPISMSKVMTPAA